MIVTDEVNDGTVTPYHLLGVAGVVCPCARVVHYEAVVVELVLEHISSEFFCNQRGNFPLRRYSAPLRSHQESSQRAA